MFAAVLIIVGLACAFASLRGEERKLAQNPTYLPGWVLYDKYSDPNCGSSGNAQIVSTQGYALNACISPENSATSVKYTADMACETITKTTYSDATCGTVDSGTPADVSSGNICSAVSTTSSTGYSQFSYCDFNVPLPSFSYDAVIQSMYITDTTSGCQGQPDELYATPSDYCTSTGTMSSQKYTCNGNHNDDDSGSPKFFSYTTSSCTGTSRSYDLSPSCAVAQYTDDKPTSTLKPDNVKFSCSNTGDDDNGLHPGAIAGIVIGAVVVSGLLCAVVIILLSPSKKKNPDEEDAALLNEKKPRE